MRRNKHQFPKSCYVFYLISFLLLSTKCFSQIDLSKPVGTTLGTAALSGTGGVNYNIPIDILKGTNGIEPTVNLIYNSQGGEGIAGYGWNLSANSVISRQGKKNYYNGKNTPISYTNTNDAFLLDGQRLFPVTGNNGDNGTVYGTENESFSKIESFGGNNITGPDWFRVTTKSGLIMEYGTDASSKLYTNYWESIMLWLLKRVRDRNGNYYEYTYNMNTSDRSFALAEINYTGNTNTGQSPFNKIEFIYNTLSNGQNRKIFEGGASIISPFLLNQILIKNQNGTTVKSYQCSYTTVKNQSFLSSFSETGADGSILNPLTFQYGSNTTAPDVSVSTPYTGFNVNTTYTTYAGDVTGDGKQDLLTAKFYYDNNNVPHFTSYDVLDNFPNYSNPSVAYTYTIPWNAPATQVQGSNNGYYNFLTYDYDGDSKQDVLMIANSTSGSQKYYNGIKINYSRRYTGGPSYQTVDYPQVPNDLIYGSYQNIFDQGTSYIPGDFDGDGAQDYILILGLSATNYYKAFFSSPSKNIINQEIAGFGVGGNSNDPFYATTVASSGDIVPVDFDGDGKMEILVQKPGVSYILSVFPVAPSTGYSYGASVSHLFSEVVAGYRVFPGDFNGDGKTDLLVRSSQYDPYAAWNMLYSTGTSFRSYPFIYQNRIYLDGDNGGSAHHLVVADMNNDGKTDIWHSLDLTTTTSRHTMYISNGVPFDFSNSNSVFSIYTYSYNAGINRSQTVQSVIGDLNFDGRPDIFSINGSNAKVIYTQPEKEENFMVKATNGIGAETRFTYVKGYNRSAAYEYDNASILFGQANGTPYTVLKTPMYVGYYMIEDNGAGGNIFTTMQYEDPMFHPYRGFMGFKKVNSNNSSTGINSTTYSDMNSTFYIPQVYRTTTDNFVNLLTETIISNNLVRVNPNNYYDKRFINQPSGTKSFNYINLSGTETASTYDSYGNVLNSTVIAGPFSGTTISPVETVTSNTSYITANTPIPCMPSTTTVTKTRVNELAIIKTTSYTYNSTGLMATYTDFAGTPLATNVTFTYDNFGNTNSQTTSAPNTPTPVVTNTYDNTGRYIISKSTSGSGITKTETYSYNTVHDQIASATTSDGLTTTYTYDGFGNILQTTLPDGAVMVTSTGWDQTYGRYYVSSSRLSDNGKYNRRYFDILNREVHKEISGFNRRTLTSMTEYNSLGLVSRKVLPYGRFEPVKSIYYNYDYLGRPTSVYNDNTTTSYTYSSAPDGTFTVTTTNGAGQSTSKTTDATGKVVSTIDNGGQLIFYYDSWGNQREVKFGATSLVVSTFDNYGRQTSLTDKNTGTIAYEYNSLGKLTKQTDANNTVHTFSYDAFGRTLSKTGPSGSTTYTYFNDPVTGKCNDNIISITGFAGDIKTYQYDNFQRPISESTSFNQQVFTKTMAYDALGNLTTTTYPSGITINDSYDVNGNHTQTSMTYGGNTQILFTGNAMNGLGIYTYYTYGNGKTSTVDYDMSNGVPTRYFTDGVQDLNLSFDYNTRNLLSRSDAIKNLTETFSYDNLNRLTSASVNNVQQFAINYDGNSNSSLGNILSKSDIGNYRYHSQKINAVRFITTNSGIPTNPPNVISVQTQTIAYTSFQKPSTISENGYQVTYSYGHDEQRIKSVLTHNGSTAETKYYLGSYEMQIKGGTTRELHYVSAGNGLCAIVVKEAGQVTPYFVYTDHLGSLLTITDGNANIVTEQNFDAWGRNRHPNDWSYNNVPARPDWLYRGYTSHEHLKEFALINMNGRMYDPATGRMLSPDNYVPLPWNTQGYNRYGYANNNPLCFVDQDGNFFWIPIIIGAVIGAYSGYQIGKAHGATGWQMFGYIVGGAAIGGVSGLTGGAIAAGIGQGLSFAGAGLVGAAVGGAVGGAISGGGFAALAGGDIGDGLWKGALSGLAGGAVGSYIGGGIGAFVGGATGAAVGTALNGGDFGDIVKSAIIGGAISWGSYEIQQHVAYNEYNKGGQPFGKLTRQGFNKISVATQRSFARGKEAGGWILKNGDIDKIIWGSRDRMNTGPKPKNGVANFHTHPNDKGTIQFHSFGDVQNEKNTNYVIGWKNTYKHDPTANPVPSNWSLLGPSDFNTLYNILMPSIISTYPNYFNPYPYYWHYFRRY